MKTQPQSVNVPNTSKIRDDSRNSNPGLRTIHDEWIYRALAVHSASTRQCHSQQE
jgi:hypothetical protein